MALIVEDGTGKTDSQTYSTVTDLDSYASLRGITLPATEAEKEVLLIKAMDYLESLQGMYKGIKANEFQALQWPRYNVYIDSYYVESDTIPRPLKEAQLVAAVIINGGGDLQPSVSPKVVEKQVDTLRIRYSEGGGTNNVFYPKLTAALRPLLGGGGSGLTVSRG